jgi:hypothetical protein
MNVREQLNEWLHETEIRELRTPRLLEKLPSDESKKWLAFWDEVRATFDAAVKANRLTPGER